MRDGGDRVTIAYRFRGGGEMIVCALSGTAGVIHGGD
jgi:hypothetical protein